MEANANGTVELKAFPPKSANTKLFRPAKLASLRPPLINVKEQSNSRMLGGSRPRGPEKPVSLKNKKAVQREFYCIEFD